MFSSVDQIIFVKKVGITVFHNNCAMRLIVTIPSGDFQLWYSFSIVSLV